MDEFVLRKTNSMKLCIPSIGLRFEYNPTITIQGSVMGGNCWVCWCETGASASGNGEVVVLIDGYGCMVLMVLMVLDCSSRSYCS